MVQGRFLSQDPPSIILNSRLTYYSQIWEYFLASSTIISRQGSATCWQLTLVKNINSTHRIEGINTQFALAGARESAIQRVGHGVVPSANIPPAAVPGKEE